MSMNLYVIWIDPNIYNEQNIEYIKELKEKNSFKLNLYNKVEDAIKYLKKLKFEETKVIVSGRLYAEFFTSFRKNLKIMCVAPKIIVFTSTIYMFLKYNKDYQNIENKFYSFGGIETTFDKIKEFLKCNKKSIKNNSSNYVPPTLKDLYLNSEYDPIISNYEKVKTNKSDQIQLTFEYIDSKEKLLLPLFFKSLIDKISSESIELYNNFIYNEYSKQNSSIQKLLGSLINIPNIPIEILSKYYARLITIESNFYKDINKDLGLNKLEKYLPYIKILYEGVKLKSLPLASNNILYRGSKISNDEIEKLKDYKNKKLKGLPGSIAFSRSFLSFTKSKTIAEDFLNKENNNKNLSKVLYIVEKDDKLEYNLSTHGDIEEISCFPNEKEVLFFPFSSFEVKEISDKNYGYEIKLLYLGKYLKDIEKDKNIVQKENQLPDCEFKKALTQSGLIKNEKIEKLSTKMIYDNFKILEKEIKENSLISIKNKKLNNGMEIPLIGLGTSRMNNIVEVIYQSIKDGLRLIDTAFQFGNEEEVGKGIKKALDNRLCKREDLFIIGKIWMSQRNDPEAAIKETLKKLKLNYLDLYLDNYPSCNCYHNPNNIIKQISIYEFWPKMEALVYKGLTKSIGLSNYNVQSILNILSFCKIKPVVNEVEFHPYYYQENLKKFCDKENIAIIAAYPLAHGIVSRYYILSNNGEMDLFKEECLKKLAKKYNKSLGQIILNWEISQGIIPIPGTSRLDRTSENLAALDFTMNDEDIKSLNVFGKKMKFDSSKRFFGINIMA